MPKKRTCPANVASQFRAVVKSMKMSAKLQGLAILVDKLKRENPRNWRMVVFTQRRETQTTIQAYLESLGVPVGIINGETTGKNQGTIAAFTAETKRDRLDGSRFGRCEPPGRERVGELRPAVEPNDCGTAHRTHPASGF